MNEIQLGLDLKLAELGYHHGLLTYILFSSSQSNPCKGCLQKILFSLLLYPTIFNYSLIWCILYCDDYRVIIIIIISAERRPLLDIGLPVHVATTTGSVHLASIDYPSFIYRVFLFYSVLGHYRSP